MDRQVQKLQKYLKEYLGQTADDIHRKMGKPLQFPDSNILFYSLSRKIIWKDEIAFIIENGKVTDITISEYVFGFAVRNIFYQNKGRNRGYLVSNLITKKHSFPQKCFKLNDHNEKYKY